jgi:hypothetical protein
MEADKDSTRQNFTFQFFVQGPVSFRDLKSPEEVKLLRARGDKNEIIICTLV